jgi:hypothetical protein
LKAVPRRAENATAKQLNILFNELGLDLVERLPVTGRTGPDISLNDIKLVVDVKSRQEIPASWLAGPGEVIFGDGMIGVRIPDVGKLEGLRRRKVRSSRIVRAYLEHMHEWTIQKCKNGISAIALRRPGMRSDATTVIIFEAQELEWYNRLQHFRSIKTPVS